MIRGTLRHQVKRGLIKLGFFKMPDFLIIGVQKGGTTFLYSLLRQHPMIVEPVHKEAHFFDYDRNYSKGLFQYKLNFDLSFRFKKDQKTFEATPDYIAHYEVPKRLSATFPNIKLILILRNPILRTFSAWKMHHYSFKNHPRHKWLHDPRTFEQVIEEETSPEANMWDLMNHVGRSLYGNQLENLFKYFDKNQVLVLFQDELKLNSQDILNRITDFVEIDKMDLKKVNTEDERFWTNTSKNDVNLNPDLIVKLQDYFKEDKLKLEKLLGHEIDW